MKLGMLRLVLGLSMILGGLTYTSCALNPAPVLSPTTAMALTNGLTALSDILHRQANVPNGVFVAITDAQQAIAQDLSGTTWAGLVRTLLSDLYSQLPQALLDKPVVWVSLATLEVILSTVGA